MTVKPIPDGLIVLTFDDGVKSHVTFVAPLLKKFGFGATFYITDQAGSTVDTATTDAGYSRRSCTDALLRRHLGIDGPGRQLFPLDRTGGL